MSSRTPRRPRWPKKPPPGLRPRLDRLKVLSTHLVHAENIAMIASGQGTQQTLYDHAHAVLVWLTLARDYHERYGTLAETLRVLEAAYAAVEPLIERWQRTGRVGFTGPELQMAREATPHMDAMAELVDRDDADAAGRAAVKALREAHPDLSLVEVPA